MKSVIPPHLFLHEGFDFPRTPCVSWIFDNSDPKDFFKINSSRPPRILLLLDAHLAMDSYARFDFLQMTVHTL
jgi:hypothetical protein